MENEKILTEKQKEVEAIYDFMHEYQGNFPPMEDENEIGIMKHLSGKTAEIIVLGKPYNWKDPENYFYLRPILIKRNIKTIYIPKTSTFTGIIEDPLSFTRESKIGEIKIMDGCITDGIVIPKNSGVLMLSADCPTIVYHDLDNDLLIAVHAGLRSIVDKQKILNDNPSRAHESVVDDLVSYIYKNSANYKIFVICGIHSSSFCYKISNLEFGNNNKKILDYLIKKYGEEAVPLGVNHGGISLYDIIKEQFIRHGINPTNIIYDGINTYTDQRFWSHSEAFFSKEEKDCGRNGILVLHK
jgi:copper oxidase (laccase) domain-containing protein